MYTDVKTHGIISCLDSGVHVLKIIAYLKSQFKNNFICFTRQDLYLFCDFFYLSKTKILVRINKCINLPTLDYINILDFQIISSEIWLKILLSYIVFLFFSFCFFSTYTFSANCKCCWNFIIQTLDCNYA